ncbi:keywimysin-related RiPP [Paenarthrobacter sp. NPDC090520]|uniref:keywimysin-related RiPP n=1 Tax=Paenarthrobacter sp. NPDC090520 TaxID=3364382 RepID=UPI00380EDD75
MKNADRNCKIAGYGDFALFPSMAILNSRQAIRLITFPSKGWITMENSYSAPRIAHAGSFRKVTNGIWCGRYRDLFCGRSIFKPWFC